MADQQNDDVGVADPSIRVLEDCSFDGSERNPVVSTGVRNVGERAECEYLGISSCTVEQEMKNVSEPLAMESTCVVKVDGEVRENLGVSGCNIEEGMGSISLVSGLEISDVIGENGGKGEIKKDEDESESSESESDNPSSPTSSTSSSSSDSDNSSTSGGSSDDDDIEDNKEEGRQEKEEGKTEKIEVEVEEGEIKDSDGQELVTETAVDDDDDNEDVEVATWSGINDDEEDDEDDTATGGPIRSKNELKDLPSVPLVNVTLEPHHQMLPVGVVLSIISTQVIVEGMEKHDPLNEGSILWMTESRTPLGLVDEIFGPVKNPYYVVRYNSENEVPAGVHVGTSISFVPEFANHVLNNKDLYKKGYDASGFNDEEVSNEVEFSDDEKEAEYRKMQKMTKRSIIDQNPGKRKNNKKASKKKSTAVPPYRVTPASPLYGHENFSPFSGMRQGHFEATTIVPPSPPTNAGPNLGLWTEGISHMQPQSSLLPNGFPHNGISWFPANTQNPCQLPMTGIPFQQQLGPNLGSLPGTSLPGVQPNIFAQPMYPQGLVGQNQMTFLSSHIAQIQASVSGGEQGFLPNELQSERNHNLHSGIIPDNRHAPHQFRAGGYANRGRKTFHQRGRKGWRPTM